MSTTRPRTGRTPRSRSRTSGSSRATPPGPAPGDAASAAPPRPARATPITRLPTTAGLPQPQSSPSVTARTTRPTAAPSTSEPARSGSRPLCRSPRGSRSAAAASATPRGTLTRKRARQSSTSTSAPPTTGPATAATDADAVHMPSAATRRSGALCASTMPSDDGIIAAAPTAWTPRATSSTSTLGARAAARDDAVKTVTPPTKRMRRPRTSASRPRGASAAAKATAYSDTTQDRVSRPASG